VRQRVSLAYTRLSRLAHYIFVADSMGLSLFKFVQWAPKDAFFSATECILAVQGHPRSIILVPIESAYATWGRGCNSLPQILASRKIFFLLENSLRKKLPNMTSQIRHCQCSKLVHPRFYLTLVVLSFLQMCEH